MGFESGNNAPKANRETAQINVAETDFNESSSLDEVHGNYEEENASPQENQSPNEQWEPEKAVIEYNHRKEVVSQKLTEVEYKLNNLYLAEEGTDLGETQIDALIAERELIQSEMIASSANYPGDWTNLLYKRLSDPASKEKFTQRRIEAMQYMGDDPSEVARREKPKSHYQDQIDSYDTDVERVFSRTEIGPAETFGSRGRNLGNMGNENVGAVFSDAEHKGSPLTDRQKNIIEAHEKGHCLRDFASSHDRQEMQGTINQSVITELNALRKANGMERIAPTYVSNPMEIAERMAQFKNYFGLGANDTFKKQHLDHIRAHYVSDTGLDNGVSDLLYVITPETEGAFLDVINKYPI